MLQRLEAGGSHSLAPATAALFLALTKAARSARTRPQPVLRMCDRSAVRLHARVQSPAPETRRLDLRGGVGLGSAAAMSAMAMSAETKSS